MGTRLFEDPVNLLRTVVVALNKDGILDPPSSHLLTSLFYRMRPVHRSLIKHFAGRASFLEKRPVYLWLLGRWEAMGRVLVGEAVPHIQVKDVEMAVHNLSFCHCCQLAQFLKNCSK